MESLHDNSTTDDYPNFVLSLNTECVFQGYLNDSITVQTPPLLLGTINAKINKEIVETNAHRVWVLEVNSDFLLCTYEDVVICEITFCSAICTHIRIKENLKNYVSDFFQNANRTGIAYAAQNYIIQLIVQALHLLFIFGKIHEIS